MTASSSTTRTTNVYSYRNDFKNIHVNKSDISSKLESEQIKSWIILWILHSFWENRGNYKFLGNSIFATYLHGEKQSKKKKQVNGLPIFLVGKKENGKHKNRFAKTIGYRYKHLYFDDFLIVKK
jgi:hypothetical protein